jgi:hypothetical protein
MLTMFPGGEQPHPQDHAAALAATRPGDACAVLDRLAVLRGRLEVPARRWQCKHGRAGRPRHVDGLLFQPLVVTDHRVPPDLHVYFEASAAVITLVLLGKLLEARAKAKTG